MVLKYIRQLFGTRKDKGDLPPLPPLPEPHTPETVHRPIPKNQIDPDVVKIIRRLTRFGHTAYIVGGGVRDLLLHRTPKDFDIGTSAQPQDVKKLFRNCRIIGRRFRLAHIFFREKIIEVATFRANVAGEESGGDGGDLLIRSDNVFGNPETDALRRDFTINALFYDVDKGNVIDYVGGIADLDAGVLRTIGDPDIRLREDPIRILRAVRLAGRLGFRIDERTRRAIRKHREEIHKAAVPRILEDILRMLRGGGAEAAFRMMKETGVLDVTLPELVPALRGSDGEIFWKCLAALDRATTRGTEFSNPTLLAPLVFPRLSRTLDPKLEVRQLSAEMDAALSPVEKRLNIPRRDRDRIRQILLAQRRFVGQRRGRRVSPSAFISRPFFPEAFDLFEIICSAAPGHRDELMRWRERIASVASDREGGRRRDEGERPRRGRERGQEGRKRSARRKGRSRRPAGEEPVFPSEAPERPDLSEEDIALVYGTVLAPEEGASLVPSPGRSPAPRTRSKKRRRPAANRDAKAEGHDEAPPPEPEGDGSEAKPPRSRARRRHGRRRGGRKRQRPSGTSETRGGGGDGGSGSSGVS